MREPLEAILSPLLASRMPAAALIGPEDEVICSSSQAARYFNEALARQSLKLHHLLPARLWEALRPALHQARQTGAGALSYPIADAGHILQWHVVPLQSERSPSGSMLLFIYDTFSAATPEQEASTNGVATGDLIASLYQQLGMSHAEIETLQRAHQDALGDLATSNEELYASNEELRSALEELEQSKHQLEGVNQKLVLTNQELMRSVTRAAKAHDDLQNFVAVSELSTIFVDRAMRLQRYTSPAAALFNLRENDRGASLLDIDLGTDYPGFNEDMAAAFHSLQRIEREIRFRNGKWYLLRLAPYRTEDHYIGGVVLTFIDISSRREAEEKLRLGEERWRLALEASGDGIWDWNTRQDQAILSPTWKSIVGAREADFTSASVREWGELIHPEDRSRVLAELDQVRRGKNAQFFSEYRIHCGNGAWKWVLSRGAAVEWDGRGMPVRIVGTMSDISEKKLSEHQIWYRANFDNLTGLHNRSFFLDRLEHEVLHAQRAADAFALLFIDLDRFKEVNDLHGHFSGDALLKQVAERLKSCTRASDTVARLGGDEFTVILGATDDVADVELICEEILGRLAQPFDLSGQIVDISASIGVTLYPRDAQQAGDLIRNADQAMYVAKNAGRNRCKFFTQAMQDAALARITVISDLHRAVPEQLRLYFQPVVDASTGGIVKAEALLRWQHPLRGLVLPGEFIPLAEEAGFVGKIGDWVFAEAARWALRWSILLQQPFQISVNKSPLEFLAGQHAPLLDWATHLDAIGLDCRNISVEITEGVLLNASAAVREKLLSLRQAGIEVAIDDFGTGYSSMSYLKKYSVDYLKIDQSFVRDMALDPTSGAITETIIVMAHKLGLKVIAEGVETEEQRDRLCAFGCDYIQGHYYSEALPAERFEQLLLRDMAPAGWRHLAS